MTATGIHPAAGRLFRPWKNGGGVTAEIATAPPGTGLEHFDWRLSTAIVASAGPFSHFPGVDRVLCVIEGGPMVLTASGREYRLDADTLPFHFTGEADVSARLAGPEVTDFNVMVRRPLAAIVRRGPLVAQARGPADRARLALLLEPAGGLCRLDLVDLDAASPALVAAIAGAGAITTRITGPSPAPIGPGTGQAHAAKA